MLAEKTSIARKARRMLAGVADAENIAAREAVFGAAGGKQAST